MSIEQNVGPQWIESQFLLWKESPDKVPADWRAFFEGFELGVSAPAEKEGLPPGQALKQAAVSSLIRRYREIGHLQACTDPLNPCPPDHPQLALEAFGLDETVLDQTFYAHGFPGESATLREIVQVLKETYCRSIGVEFMHIQNPAEREWLRRKMEPVRNRPSLSHSDRLAILRKLMEASLFESFLHRKFLGQKRFSLEGGEVIIPFLDHLIRHASEAGVTDLILGMSHRGRLNVLANVFRKPLPNIFAEFSDNLELGFVGEGDVKYHKGYSTDRTFSGGHSMHLTMAFNPSHLESVDPVVLGKCRARHVCYGPGGRQKVLPVLIHGDAAFAGQGMVAETLNLSQLDGYQSGGTLHLVVNNQIGFTTAPEHARSTHYATDVAKMLMAPVFHVNGEDPEAAVFAASLAFDYRRTFAKDVVVEVICFRRQGHNEGDEPSFTQPLMYQKIEARPPGYDVYSQHLAEEGLDSGNIDSFSEKIEKRLEAAVDAEPTEKEVGFGGKWSGIQRKYSVYHEETGIDADRLRELAQRITTVPPEFNLHPKVTKLLERRFEAVDEDSGIDWGTAEALAFASLLSEEVPVRLSGQDSRRGTFNQRHAVLVDQHNGQAYVPLAYLGPGQAPVQVYNSMLSEAAVLGFEFGHSLETPKGLTIWEAQFGDFANGAQVIIDQFIVSSGAKWDRNSGLVMFLPHGYEGQGPEHSSARIERYLQLCANNNIQVTCPSTPAQFFHLLRRQVKQPFRRPLIVFTPKSLLRLPACRSKLEAFSRGRFQEVLDPDISPEQARSVLICTGKIFYDLQQKRDETGRDDVALVRIEQLYPLEKDRMEEVLSPFGKTERIAWVQEEPRNMGAWAYLRPLLSGILGRDPEYVGREEAPSPAVGSHRQHGVEQEKILERALSA
jgi:2-oxoglutarate dehydrogenase E1 component